VFWKKKKEKKKKVSQQAIDRASKRAKKNQTTCSLPVYKSVYTPKERTRREKRKKKRKETTMHYHSNTHIYTMNERKAFISFLFSRLLLRFYYFSFSILSADGIV